MTGFAGPGRAHLGVLPHLGQAGGARLARESGPLTAAHSRFYGK
jgi:hypothetical protein